jgi:hypothetical protein
MQASQQWWPQQHWGLFASAPPAVLGIAPWHGPTCFSVASASRPRWMGPSYTFLKVLSVPSRPGHARSNTAWNSDRSFWMGVPAAEHTSCLACATEHQAQRNAKRDSAHT